MEAMDIILAASRDLSYSILNHPVYSVFGCFVLSVCLVRFYCRLTVGICDSEQDMQGKTVLITGASAGIGKTAAKDLARRNARVILACRNVEKAKRVADEIISSTGNSNVVVKHLDLSSFDSVRKCAEDVLRTEEKLHVLINNAGTYVQNREITEDGCEKVLQSNHLGHFLLTLLLLDSLKKSSPSRIINVSSGAYTMGKLNVDDMIGKNCNSGMELYSRSKLANVLFTRELATKLSNSGVTVNALHPGVVKTDIMQSVNGIFAILTIILMLITGKSCEEGAQTTIFLAIHPNVEKTTGKYFADCKEEKLKDNALDESLAKKLFEASEKIVGMSYHRT